MNVLYSSGQNIPKISIILKVKHLSRWPVLTVGISCFHSFPVAFIMLSVDVNNKRQMFHICEFSCMLTFLRPLQLLFHRS